MTLDICCHGNRRMKNKISIQGSSDWLNNPHEFTQDLNHAMIKLKSRRILNYWYHIVIKEDVDVKHSEVRQPTSSSIDRTPRKCRSLDSSGQKPKCCGRRAPVGIAQLPFLTAACN